MFVECIYPDYDNADKNFENFCSNAHCLGMKDHDKYQEKAEDKDKDKDLEKNKDQI